jgi:hypothetical protein
MATEIKLFDSAAQRSSPLFSKKSDISLWDWVKSEVHTHTHTHTKVDTRDELLARILDAFARIKKREDELRRKTRDLRTRVAMCTEVDGGIFEHLL